MYDGGRGAECVWDMTDLRGWEGLCMVDSGRGYQCQADYHHSSLISLYQHHSYFTLQLSTSPSSPSIISPPPPPQLTETLQSSLQCLLGQIVLSLYVNSTLAAVKKPVQVQCCRPETVIWWIWSVLQCSSNLGITSTLYHKWSKFWFLNI